MAKGMGTSSADAARKRSIARRFNDVLTNRSPKAKALDRRTARRLERYRRELTGGRKGRSKDLSPLDVAMRVHELLRFGDRITDLRKLAKPRQIEYDETQMVALLKEMHPVYGFRPEAYRFAGVSNETLVAAGVLSKMPARRGPRPRAETAPKRAAPSKRASGRASKS